MTKLKLMIRGHLIVIQHESPRICISAFKLQDRMKDKFVDETLPKGLLFLEGFLKQNSGGNGYFVGNKVGICYKCQR